MTGHVMFDFENVIRAGIHKMLVRTANREDPDQTASSEAVRSGSALFAVLTSFCEFPSDTVWIQIRTERMPMLIWIQTVWHSDSQFKSNFV